MNKVHFSCALAIALLAPQQGFGQKMPPSAIEMKRSDEKASGISLPDVKPPREVVLAPPQKRGLTGRPSEKPGETGSPLSCEEYFKRYGKKHATC